MLLDATIVLALLLFVVLILWTNKRVELTMCDDLYDNVQMLTNSVIVMCKVILATLQSATIKWQR